MENAPGKPKLIAQELAAGVYALEKLPHAPGDLGGLSENLANNLVGEVGTYIRRHYPDCTRLAQLDHEALEDGLGAVAAGVDPFEHQVGVEELL